jgi:hypothetical protein
MSSNSSQRVGMTPDELECFGTQIGTSQWARMSSVDDKGMATV